MCTEIIVHLFAVLVGLLLITAIIGVIIFGTGALLEVFESQLLPLIKRVRLKISQMKDD